MDPTRLDLSDRQTPPRPGPLALAGRHVRLEPLGPGHAAALHRAYAAEPRIWDYLPYGPFPDETAYAAWVTAVAAQPDPRFLAILPRDADAPQGVASLMRATPEHATIEIGHLGFAPALQRTPAATEAIFLMADWAFTAGYRRVEWKCNAANGASRRAATRFGFVFEGVFRQHMIVKGRNRDTAWYSIVDADWPELADAFRTWLDPANFDGAGQQRLRLANLTAPLRERAEAAQQRL